MAVLVTRPEPDNAMTAETLRRRGFDVLLAPVLRCQTLPFRYDDRAQFAGIIVTSANALRAISAHPLSGQLGTMPVFAVGERTADVARANGFANVIAADGDAVALRKLVIEVAGRRARKTPLLYLSGADVSGDIAADLAARGIAVTALTVYRMAAIADVPPKVSAAFAAHAIQAVLHYSSRSAHGFVAAMRAEGLEIAGLGVLQVCISEPVARVLREAGATRAVSAEKPREDAMIDILERSLAPPRG